MEKKANGTKDLRPPQSSAEAKERGRKGGIKSGESRRKKREAKEAIRLLLNLAAKGNLDKNLANLGVEEQDRTNMLALNARLFTKAMEGDTNAYRALMEYGGFAPDQALRDEERIARIEAIKEGGRANAIVSGDSDEGGGGDVIIYLPEIEEEPSKGQPDTPAPTTADEAQEGSEA